jgi:uncharacterized protein YggE
LIETVADGRLICADESAAHAPCLDAAAASAQQPAEPLAQILARVLDGIQESSSTERTMT